LFTAEFTVERNRINVTCVTKVSTSPPIYRFINVMYTATEDLMTVVTVGSYLKVAMNWSFMFVFTLVQSRTHVDTVQTVLHGLTNSRHICWSHTMKVLGSHVTFVWRNSLWVVNYIDMYVVMKVWSRMFAVNVQWVSVQQMDWKLISQDTQTSSHSVAVHVVNILKSSRDVLRNWDIVMSSCNVSSKLETEIVDLSFSLVLCIFCIVFIYVVTGCLFGWFFVSFFLCWLSSLVVGRRTNNQSMWAEQSGRFCHSASNLIFVISAHHSVTPHSSPPEFLPAPLHFRSAHILS